MLESLSAEFTFTFYVVSQVKATEGDVGAPPTYEEVMTAPYPILSQNVTLNIR